MEKEKYFRAPEIEVEIEEPNNELEAAKVVLGLATTAFGLSGILSPGTQEVWDQIDAVHAVYTVAYDEPEEEYKKAA